jgi:hypothetical protein
MDRSIRTILQLPSAASSFGIPICRTIFPGQEQVAAVSRHPALHHPPERQAAKLLKQQQ